MSAAIVRPRGLLAGGEDFPPFGAGFVPTSELFIVPMPEHVFVPMPEHVCRPDVLLQPEELPTSSNQPGFLPC